MGIKFSQYLILFSYIFNSFELNGDSSGSEGAESKFLGKVLVTNGNLSENQFYDLEMSSSRNGSFTIEVPDGETQLLFTVVSVPEYFKGHQTYGYRVNIRASNLPNTGVQLLNLPAGNISSGALVTTISKLSPFLKLRAKIRINNTTTDYAALWHFTTGANEGEGSRIPAIFQFSDPQNQIYIQFGSKAWSWPFQIGTWHTIEVSQTKEGEKVVEFKQTNFSNILI